MKVTTGVTKSAATPDSFEPGNDGRKNDPALWTEEGLQDALDESVGEMGTQIEWGYIKLASVYTPPKRELNPQDDIPSARGHKWFLDLWAAVTVDEDKVKVFLRTHADQMLPPGTRYELRKKTSGNFGRSHGMCWYRNEAMDKREKWGQWLTLPEERMGYLLVGEFTTPGEKPVAAAAIVGERE